jgi:tight adherence protein C
MMPLAIGPVWIAIVYGMVSLVGGRIGETLANQQAVFYLLGLGLLFLYPMTWLRSALAERHRSIQRSLPFMLDLLTLSVEAGMDFMSALQRAVDRRDLNALGEELLRVVRQIQLGKTRRQALRDLIARVDQPDVTSVVSAIVQADELGVSVGSILRIQSDQIRRKRFDRAEKLANEAPIKLLFPLIFFIFPAVFFILLGPIVMEFVRQGF